MKPFSPPTTIVSIVEPLDCAHSLVDELLQWTVTLTCDQMMRERHLQKRSHSEERVAFM